MSSPNQPAGREIRHVALLDLTGAQAASALDGVTSISDVATILVPESLLPKLSSISMSNIAATIPVPDGRRTKVFSGQIILSGDALANAGAQSEEMMVVAGQLIVTSPVKHVGYSDLVVLGQVIAPVGSETALGTGVSRLSGQMIYYPYVEGATLRLVSGSTVSGEALGNSTGDPSDMLLATGHLVVTSPIQRLGYQQIVAIGYAVLPNGTDTELVSRFTSVSGQVTTYSGTPRVFDGKDHFSAGFFELFDTPITLVLDGKFSFDEDVTPELLRRTVAGIVLDGKLTAPRRLVPMLQMLCFARDGKIAATDEPE
jgi:hypothetical protein